MNNDLMLMVARDHLADLDREVEASRLVAHAHADATRGRSLVAALRQRMDHLARRREVGRVPGQPPPRRMHSES